MVKNKDKILLVGYILAGVIIVIVAINILKDRSVVEDRNGDFLESTINYIVTSEGYRLNMSEEVVEDKKIGNILIQESKIVYQNETSKLSSKITNDGIIKDNLRLRAKYIANDGTTITEAIVYVGAIREYETKYIDSYITADVSNARNIIYELIE